MVVAVSLCSKCGSHTDEQDLYCQECGGPLSLSSKQQEPAEKSPSESELSSSHLFANLSPRSAKSVVALPLMIAGIVLVILIACGIYALESSFALISGGYISDQARQALDKGHDDEAIELLNRLSLAHGGLSTDQQRPMDEALLHRADRYIVAGSYQPALADLRRISGKFARAQEVKERIDVCKRYVVEAPERVQTPAASKVQIRHRKSVSEHAKARATKLAPSAPLKTDSIVGEESVRSKGQRHFGTANGKIVEADTPATLGDGDASPSARSDTQAKTAHAAPDGSADSRRSPAQAQTLPAEKPMVSYAQRDVARYNELLAGYFSAIGGKSGTAKAAELREPPTIQEWIKSGRANF